MKNFIKKLFFNPFKKISPLSPVFGLDRGQPIDRYYIEKFLEKNKPFVFGHVLEIGENTYTKRFGGEKVKKIDVLHVTNEDSSATIVADLAEAKNIESNQFDCIILTQTLQCIYEKEKVIKNLFRILKPGGVVLATASGISQISQYDMDRWGEYWRFTTLSAKKLFCEAFPEKNVEVESHGNVLAAVAALHGLASHEVKQKKLDFCDPRYQLIITIRAQKPLER